MSDIPEWAKERVRQMLSREEVEDIHEPAKETISRAFARYIAEHEEPPYWDEACRVIRETYGPTRQSDGVLGYGEGPRRVEAILGGEREYWEARAVMAALKRGMELAREEKP